MKYFWLVVYYCLAYWLPSAITPVVGRPSKRFRRLCVANIFYFCGEEVNIDRKVFFGSGFRISIGDHSGIGRNSKITSQATIGRDVMIGPKFEYLGRNHRFSDVDVPMRIQGYSDNKPLSIGDDVWIGKDVLVLPGKSIGNGVVVAARSVVTKEIPSNVIVGGNPTRIIGSR